MTIIVSKDGKDSVKVSKSDFEAEDKIQELIHNNVEHLPFYDQGNDLHLLSLAREFPTKHGPIDVIGIDDLGNVYIIEAKLHRNSTRRDVMAQVIDYASAIWAEYKNFEIFEKKMVEKTGHGLFQFIKNKDVFSGNEDEDVELIVQQVKQNIQNGNFKFVIVMDKLDEKLTEAVDFLNSKSSFSIYAVTFDYYKPEGLEIIIPNVYGREAEKSSTTKSTSIRHKWSEEDFEKLVSHNSSFTDSDRKSISKIITFTKEMMSSDWEDYWHQYFENTGKDPSFIGYLPAVNEEKSLYYINGRTGTLTIQFWALKDKPDLQKEFLQKCREYEFEIISTTFDERGNSWMNIKKDEWMSKTDQFISILRESFSK